ncbi:modular serine protease [Drosophila ficusphila]|uniref:modular serine protease n=1 Tax=Drosophila ficusphila TaxID=30025 RepID=UPI0007E87D38|nr:modular serine protease [Drosophila ficusphila]
MKPGRSLLDIVLFLVLLCILDLTFSLDCVTTNNQTLQNYQICDGIVNCLPRKDSERPDEKFELCYNKVCDGENFFRCTYGGCLNATRKCDGKIDCWDGSDENKFECSADADLQKEYEDLTGNCVDEELFDCKGSCLNWSQVCDGKADCKNARDEDPTLCKAIECPPPAFRCLYGACVSPNALCNHISDCVDGSDEMEEICLARNPPKASVSGGPKPSWAIRHCKLRDPSNSMVVEDYVGGSTFQRNATVPDHTVVHLRCLNGQDLIGIKINICDGDKWRYPMARCLSQCKYTGSLVHSGQCTLNGRLIDCDGPVLPTGTQMEVTCSSGYEQMDKNGIQFCHGNGSWVVSKKLPTCEPICGVWQMKNSSSLSTPPWLMTIFQRGHKPEFRAVCEATIVSPYILVTTAHCFRNATIRNVASTEPVLYTVAEGELNINSFLQHEPHPYKLHNISYIHNVSVSDGVSQGYLAVVHLVQPLEFDVRLRPACLTKEVTKDWVISGNYIGLSWGGPTIDDKRQSGRYELKEIISDGFVKYHIGPFVKAIQNDIAETQAKGNI